MKHLLNIVLLLTGIFIGSAMSAQQPEIVVMETIVLPEIVIEPESNEQIIYNTLVENGVCDEMAKIIVAQAKHESASFNSKLFRKTNNPFGMMHPTRRQTTSKGTLAMFDHTTTKKFAVYDDIQCATLDYIYYMDTFHYPKDFTSIKSYVSFLKKKRYFEADEALYLNAVRTHYKKLIIKTYNI
jgi:uncharacterized FlgJ-related protein